MSAAWIARVPLALEQVEDDEHQRGEDPARLKHALPRRRLARSAASLWPELLAGVGFFAAPRPVLAADSASSTSTSLALVVDVDVLVLVAAFLLAAPPLLPRRHRGLA